MTHMIDASYPVSAMIKRLAVVLAFAGATGAWAVPSYLNIANISVTVGPGTSPGTFNNTFNSGATIDKVIDAPSAEAEEFHNQSTHIWFTAVEVGGGLELMFDFGTEYDITTLHFWNYNGEDYDVDNIEFDFFDMAHNPVGALSIQPALGASPAIVAQHIALAAPLNVQFVTAFLTGDNRQVDFQNIGFTAELSESQPPPANVPDAGSTLSFLALGLLTVRFARCVRMDV